MYVLLKFNTSASPIFWTEKKRKVRTSNDIIAGNGRILKVYMFIIVKLFLDRNRLKTWWLKEWH